MARIEKLWFDANRIYLLTDAGETLSRPLEAFPVLKKFAYLAGVKWLRT